MTPNIIEINGRKFVPAEDYSTPTWPCVISEEPQPTLTLKDNDMFLVADTLGNISGSLEDDINASMGLFCCDTRFLSRLELQIEQRAPVLLSSSVEKGLLLSVLCTNPRLKNVLQPDTLGVRRELVFNGGLFEEIEISNYSTSPVKFELSLSFGADFVDLFEVRGYERERRGQLLQMMPEEKLQNDTSLENGQITENQVSPDEQYELESIPEALPSNKNSSSMVKELILAYRGLDESVMESRIEFFHQKPDYLQGSTAVWQLEINSHETTKLGYRLQMYTNNRVTSVVSGPTSLMQAKGGKLLEQQDWTQKVTRISADKAIYNQMIERAEQDIYTLRQTFGNNQAISAGVPWFSTLFGRDSIIAASQILILDPSIAQATLTTLAHYQGTKEDEWRDEQPGKILHELRLGEMARCNEIPHTPYYGTVDATPLWLMLYAEYYAWTNDRETLELLWPNALAAMDWIDSSCKETGYLSYMLHSKRGLFNQGWKDSGDCIVNRQGEMATGPIALCEVQAYVYAAKTRLAEIAKIKKRLDLVERWQEEAQDLKMRFNRDFWVEDQGYCALALDGEGNRVDSITSNPGHCLSIGILTSEKAYSVAERLRAPDMSNGWGIRTLSSLSPAYNPMGYHIGSVWPHDNALIAQGLRSLGLIDQALEVAQGMFDMTLKQPGMRPPELFCGYERLSEDNPVRYPVACSPQAWATGSIFQLLGMMVNLVPDAPGNCLRIIEPTLPESIQHLSLNNLRVGSTLLDLEFERSNGTTACRVARKRGNLRVVIEA
ncbi:glycogen debranching N-terminal domain-containing protein [Lyngbya aestuarii]|uniref:glycogen debranching N-terminal domain-containing protein n=1 Tax=Lyngbya aestuarii TaxID=118322 RepID=UPI00403DDA71